MHDRHAAITIALFLALGAATLALAQPHASRQAVPPPSWARSAEVVDDGAVVYVEPRAGARRRGTVAIGTRLPLVRRVGGTGCHAGFWVQLGDGAFVCEEMIRPSPAPPGGVPQPRMRDGDLLPFRYAFVRDDAARAYAHPSDYFADDYADVLGEGFGLVVTGRTVYEGVRFLQTLRGHWVPSESLRPASGSTFEGVEIAEGAPLDVAWVLRADVPVHDRPRGRVVRRAGKREVVRVAAVLRGGLVRLADGTHVADRDLARTTIAPPPSGLAPGERWIDVDVAEQVLVVWEGDRPVFATLVSTGRPGPDHQTPLGVFRIWVKLATSDMDDLEDETVSSNYAIQSVPWVQYFEGSAGLHAAFWHDHFGHRRSHGCINLSPRDARRLFGMTRPALPPGWSAILPTDRDPGTLVRVRDGNRAAERAAPAAAVRE